jgi:hypothetical protein
MRFPIKSCQVVRLVCGNSKAIELLKYTKPQKENRASPANITIWLSSSFEQSQTQNM